MNPIFERLNPADLDELVHEVQAEEAAAINNGGLEEQILYLVAYYGTEDSLITTLKTREILP